MTWLNSKYTSFVLNMCLDVKWKLKIAESQHNLRRHLITTEFRDVPLFSDATAQLLSDNNTVVLPI